MSICSVLKRPERFITWPHGSSPRHSARAAPADRTVSALPDAGVACGVRAFGSDSGTAFAGVDCWTSLRRRPSGAGLQLLAPRSVLFS
jgi:hypothetical protein